MTIIPMQATLKINQAQFERAVKKEILDSVNAAFLLRRDSLEARLKTLVADTLRGSVTLQELAGGPLQGELGLISPGPIIDTIVRLVSDSLYIDFKIYRSFRMTTKIICQPKDYAGLLNEGIARYVSVNRNNGNYLIDWLYWLLFEGDRIIITNFHSVFGSFATSRSKMAIMKPGGGWKMPAAHAGTADDNFITRAIGLDSSTQSSFQQQFDQIIKEEITDRM